MDKRIAVIGSLNVDLVSRVPRFLKPGETLKGLDFHVYPGGKGGNQAIAASRLYPGVMMLGKLGDDANAEIYHRVFREEGVDSACVKTATGSTTGTAVIEVDDSTGNNRIILVPGANEMVDEAQINRHWEHLQSFDIFLLQLEIPIETVWHAVKRLRKAGKTIILDPAPAATLPKSLLEMVDVLTPNEVELAFLTEMPTDTPEELIAAGKRLLRMGARQTILKAGRHGAWYLGGKECKHYPGYSVQAVDTTAAGDSFNAGLAVALAQGDDFDHAIPYANAVAALSTTRAGAQRAMPYSDQVAEFLRESKFS